MNELDTKIPKLLIALLILVSVVAIAVMALRPRAPAAPGPELGPAGLRSAVPTALAASDNTTSFTDLVVADLEVLDDTFIGDDVSIGGDLSLAGGLTGPALGTENLRLPTIETAAIITSTDGALWTVAASEIWFVHSLYCRVTTNFDCTGDDCILHIGDGNDEDGLLDLDDAELQAADTEMTGAPAGWQGFGSTATRGAYLGEGLGFVYVGAETIDIVLKDSSDNSDPTAGAATCYLVYTRIQ
jgi:hypothetical protein